MISQEFSWWDAASACTRRVDGVTVGAPEPSPADAPTFGGDTACTKAVVSPISGLEASCCGLFAALGEPVLSGQSTSPSFDSSSAQAGAPRSGAQLRCLSPPSDANAPCVASCAASAAPSACSSPTLPFKMSPEELGLAAAPVRGCTGYNWGKGAAPRPRCGDARGYVAAVCSLGDRK